MSLYIILIIYVKFYKKNYTLIRNKQIIFIIVYFKKYILYRF